MKKIVGVLRPFVLEQNFYVYEDGNKIDTAEPTVEEINDTIFNFIDKYQVTQVDLVGPKQYSKGISKKLKEAEIKKYSRNIIEINLI